MSARRRRLVAGVLVVCIAALGAWLWRAHEAGDRPALPADADVAPMRPGWRPDEPALSIPAPAGALAGIEVDDARLEAALAAWRPHLECLRLRGFGRRARMVDAAIDAAADGDAARAAALEAEVARYDACGVADVEPVLADLQVLEALGAAGQRRARFAFANGLGELAADRRWRSEVTPWLIAKAGIAQGWMEAEAAAGDLDAMGWLALQHNPSTGRLLDADHVAAQSYSLAARVAHLGGDPEDALARDLRAREALGMEPFSPEELERIRARARALLDARGG